MANNIRKYTQEWKKDESGVILIPDEVLLEGAIEKTKNKLIFSKLGGRRSQPKHAGDKMVKRVKVPVLHPENHLDNGINANAAVFMKNRWYAYDDKNVMIGNPDGYPTQSDADDVDGAVAANTKSSAGTCYYGNADFNTIKANIPVLGEEGGNVNAVNVSSKYIYGRVYKRGIKSTWYKDAIDKDSRKGLLAETAQGLMEAVKDLREAEIQNMLLEHASNNVVLPSTASSASISSLTTDNVLDYATIRSWELKLKKLQVPYVTKMVFGSTKVDTKTIDGGWVVYIGQEATNTVRDMVDSNGKSVFDPAHMYGGNVKLVDENEIGRVGKFRFVEVFNMQSQKGAGADHDDDLPAGYETDDKYDVFPALLVGQDSFDILDYSANTMQLRTAMPKVIPNLDDYGEVGTMSIKYWIGCLILRSERLSVAKFCIQY